MSWKKKANKIIKFYKAVGVPMDIPWYSSKGNRLMFKIKFLPGTTEKKIRFYLGDIRQALKLQLFQLHREGFKLFFVAAKEKTTDNRLLRILMHPAYKEYTKNMSVPYVIGFDVMGRPVIVDLISYIHWLLGGSSNSGKTVGLLVILVCIAWSCSPSDVNLIVFDGASNLTQFDGLPHLSHPVIQDPVTGLGVILALRKELERRISIKNTKEFCKLPVIICVLDEFHALISGVKNKEDAKMLIEALSNLLQHGRHGKIHMVLAAQDPTIKDMQCAIGNITARIAFTCAKLNYSMTILGEAGAEKLAGNGELYFKSPKHSGLQYLQGAYIAPDELNQTLFKIKSKLLENLPVNNEHKFVIDESGLQSMEFGLTEALYNNNISGATRQSANDALFAKIVMWTLGRKTASANAIHHTFKNTFNNITIGERKAGRLLERLYKLGIVSEANVTAKRNIIPVKIEDLSEEVISLLTLAGYREEDIAKVFNSKGA